jgi:hypothetical protein
VDKDIVIIFKCFSVKVRVIRFSLAQSLLARALVRKRI